MRRKRNYKRERQPDLKYDNIIIGRFINYLMSSGRKSIAEGVMYDALDIVEKESKQSPVTVL